MNTQIHCETRQLQVTQIQITAQIKFHSVLAASPCSFAWGMWVSLPIASEYSGNVVYKYLQVSSNGTASQMQHFAPLLILYHELLG